MEVYVLPADTPVEDAMKIFKELYDQGQLREGHRFDRPFESREHVISIL